MDLKQPGLCILAGNSRASRDTHGNIVVEAQLRAFDAALHLARQVLDSGKPLPGLSVAFDHQGIFRLQFLAENLTNSQKRHPRLSHLHPSIQHIFLPVAEKHRIALSDIHAIHEDSARQHLTHTLNTQELPERLVRRMRSGSVDAPESSQKLTCAAITTEYFARAADNGYGQDSRLEVFFEPCAWSESLAYVRGLQLSHLLGVSASIRLNLVDASGRISQGEWITPRPLEQEMSSAPHA
nr:hypothetical protein [Pantoea cypripedii]